MKFADIDFSHLPGLLGPAFEAMGLDISSNVGDIMDTAAEAAKEKARILLKETGEVADSIDAVIEENLGFLSTGGVGEAFDATADAATNAAKILNKFGTDLATGTPLITGELKKLFEAFELARENLRIW